MKLHKKLVVGIVLALAMMPLSALIPKTALAADNAATDLGLHFVSQNVIQGKCYDGSKVELSSQGAGQFNLVAGDCVKAGSKLFFKETDLAGDGWKKGANSSPASGGNGFQYKTSKNGAWKRDDSVRLSSSTPSSGGGGGSSSGGGTEPGQMIDWSGAKAKFISGNNANEELQITFKDGSVLTLYDSNPTDDKHNFKPKAEAVPWRGTGAIISSWCSSSDSDNESQGVTVDVAGKKATVNLEYNAGKGCKSDTNGGHTLGVDTTAFTDPGSGEGDEQPSCEASGFNLSWIFCPIINGAADAADGIYRILVVPLLATNPINLSNADEDPTHTFQIWSNFRVYGNIVLVITLLVIVFGESIGGGVIDAYTAKKVLPRLLIAAILINLSIYIVAVLVDFTNILGKGMENLIEAPFKDAGQFKLSLSGVTSDLGMGAILGTGAVIWKLGIAGPVLQFLGFAVVLPAFLTLVGILITLMLRQGLIMLLILVSPIAFALYCLPNTEQYFRKWWSLLAKTLLIYPLVGVFFATGNVLAVTINATTSGLESGLGDLLAIAAMFIPLALIPFSFRIAGGILGRAMDFAGTAGTQVQNLTKGRRERAQQTLQRRTVQGRQNWYSSLQNSGSRGGALRRRGYGALARTVGGYNIESQASETRANVAKELNEQIDAGKDDEIRGLTVDKELAARTGGRRERNGVIQYRSLGGQWINEADVDAGHRRWGKDTFAQQAALAYEMRKADSEEDVDRIARDYAHLATQVWGMDNDQAGGAWIGAAFANQNQHVEYKYTNWQNGLIDDGTERGAERREGFLSEIYEKRGSYNMAQMHAKTIDRLSDIHAEAVRTGDTDTQRRVAQIAETFMSRYGGGGMGGEGAELQVGLDNAGRPTATPSVQTMTPGAAHVAERVRKLAVQTGVYQQPHPDTDDRPLGGPPTIARQN